MWKLNPCASVHLIYPWPFNPHFAVYSHIGKQGNYGHTWVYYDLSQVYSYKKEKFRHVHAKREWPVKTGYRQARTFRHWKRGPEQILSYYSQRENGLMTPWLHTSTHRGYKTILFVLCIIEFVLLHYDSPPKSSPMTQITGLIIVGQIPGDANL